MLAVGIVYSVKTPEVVTLATLFRNSSVNHRFPSGPAAMPPGLLLPVGTVYSVKTPEVVTLATLLASGSVNQRFSSGPAVVSLTPINATEGGTGYSVKVADVVTVSSSSPP